MDTLIIIASTLTTIGEVGLGVIVYLVHHKMEQDHKIDTPVIRVMHKEQLVVILCILCILVGWVLEIYSYSHY